MRHALLFSVFVIAACGLAYELIVGALSSYLLGDSVTQFSTVIGTYLFAMGIGSWLSRYITQHLVLRFIQIELLVGVIGGFAALGLFLTFAWLSTPFKLLLYLVVLLVGILVGLEIPLVMRILKNELALRELVSQVLTFDYLGALLVSLLFPLVLAPQLGIVQSGLLFGLLNAAVALWAMYLFREQLRPGHQDLLRWQAGLCFAVLLSGCAASGFLSNVAENHLYADEVIHSETTPYQRLVITRWHDDLRLHLNNNLQFSSQDEYRYHEALVHPGLASVPWAKEVLVLGGGDGLAVREILKYPQVEKITLVDLDPAMTKLFSSSALLNALNQNALNSPKVKIINADALQWLETNPDFFDFVVVDFPDPNNYALGKLYSTAFYRLLDKHLRPQGRVVIQSTSPYYARQTFWTVVNTLESVGFSTQPYHAWVPSFGEWGYILAGHTDYVPPSNYTVPLRYLDAATTRSLFVFPPDMGRVSTEVNRLDNQILVRTFEAEWKRVLR